MRTRPRLPSTALALCALALVAGCNGSESDGDPARTSDVPQLAPADALRLVELQNRGIGLLEQYEYMGAIEPLRAALELAPDWRVGRYHLSLALLNAGPETRKEARTILEDLAAKGPDDPHVRFMAGVLAQNGGDDESARAHFEAAWKLTRDPVVGAKLGLQLASGISEEDERRAFEILSEVHAMAPALVAPVNQLNLLHGLRGETERQAAFLEKLQRLNGEALNPNVEASKAGQQMQIAYGNLGPYSMAIRDFADPGTGLERPELVVTASEPVAISSALGDLPAGAPPYLGAAWIDFDQDGDLDLCVAGGSGPVQLLRNDGELAFTDVAEEAGVALTGVYGVAAGELDVGANLREPGIRGRMSRVDLILLRADDTRLFLNQGDGTFTDETESSGLAGDPGGARAALVFDADQEGDLDLFLSGAAGTPNRLWANRGPGRFEEVAEGAGVAGDGAAYGAATVVDADDDLDLDVLVTRPTEAPVLLTNERLLNFREGSATTASAAVIFPHGTLVADFTRDGHEDVLLPGDAQRATTLFTGTGTGRGFEPRTIASGVTGPAVHLDLRLWGLRDVVFADGNLLPATADGFGDPQPLFEGTAGDNVLAGDVTGDGVEDLVLVGPGRPVRVIRLDVVDRGTPLVLDFEGVIRNDLQAGWSNLEGRGALAEVKSGPFWQMRRVGSPQGYAAGAPTRLVFGVGDAPHADFVRMLWPDGVQQGVLDVPVGAPQVILEEQRRPDSCPLLFSWDGERYAFVTDFIGAGGVGFLIAPGVYGASDPSESVKVPSDLVAPDEDGFLRFKFVEPMQEVCYLDTADLVVVDHPGGTAVFPEERFAGEPPFPQGRLLVHEREIIPVAARDESGTDVLDAVLRSDRRYPESGLHPRLLGATDELDVLELDFGTALAELPADTPLAFHADSWIEYGYTRTSVAAAGEGFEYVLPMLEAWVPAESVGDGDESAGEWVAVAPDLGYPAGFPRVMTYDLTGKLPAGTSKLRIRTNFEVYWDRVWLAPLLDTEETTRQTVVTLHSADLRWLGYPREFSPDGREPRIYDYHTLDPTMPWKTVTGDYTRFGDVRPLLTGEADDMYVIFGKGEEIDARFDTSGLPELPDGWTRSYVLRFTGWCKGQELYTAHGFTVEPLPFLGMSGYPYGPDEHYPDTAEHQEYRRTWNTRRVRSTATQASPR